RDSSCDGESMLRRIELHVQFVIGEGESFAIERKTGTCKAASDQQQAVSSQHSANCNQCQELPASKHWISFAGEQSRTSPPRRRQKRLTMARCPAWGWKPG